MSCFLNTIIVPIRWSTGCLIITPHKINSHLQAYLFKFCDKLMFQFWDTTAWLGDSLGNCFGIMLNLILSSICCKRVCCWSQKKYDYFTKSITNTEHYFFIKMIAERLKWRLPIFWKQGFDDSNGQKNMPAVPKAPPPAPPHCLQHPDNWGCTRSLSTNGPISLVRLICSGMWDCVPDSQISHIMFLKHIQWHDYI